MTRWLANDYNYLVTVRRDLPNDTFTSERNEQNKESNSTELHEQCAAMTRRKNHIADKDRAGKLWRRAESGDYFSALFILRADSLQEKTSAG